MRDTGYFRKVGRRYVPVLDWTHPFEPSDGVLPAAHADLTTSLGRMAEIAHKLGMGRTAHALREALAAAGLDLSELVSKNVQGIRSKIEQATSCE